MLVRHHMSFDLQTPYWHLDAAADLAADFPETQIIINHAGLPADAIAIFGTGRCLFASNFPVDSLVADFATIFSGFQEITRDLPHEDIVRLFHDNAVRIYRLKQQPAEERE